MNGKLELQYHHATVLLKNEIKVRKQVSDEKKSLVGCANLNNHAELVNGTLRLSRKNNCT